MRRPILACAGIALGMMAAGAFAATKHPARKGAAGLRRARPSARWLPAPAMASSRPAIYRSRYGTLALHADVKQGQPTDYFVLADGKRLAAAPAPCPIGPRIAPSKRNCQSRPPPATSPCTGQRFKVVLAHAGNQRLALLYGFDGSAWHYCSAGSY